MSSRGNLRAARGAPVAGAETTEVYLSAREVARHLGVRTATLAKWRYLGKGPKGWLHLSETHVAYPVAELEAWKAERSTDSRRPNGFRTQHKSP